MVPNVSFRVKGRTGLLITVAIVVAVLIAFPAYRIFLGISIGLGVIIAGLLYLRNKYRPITDKDVENKRPLGLS